MIDPNPKRYEVPLEPGISGVWVAAALVGWLQRECGATAGEYDLDGSAVTVPVQVPARRMTLATTRLHSRITRQHSQQLVVRAEELLRRSHARQSRARALLQEARRLRCPRAA